MNSSCKHSSECIRYQTYLNTSEDTPEILVVNPRALKPGQPCPNHAIQVTVPYAFGFAAILDRIPRADAKAIHAELALYFGRNPYYERRNGSRPISPAEQEHIIQTFRQHGITTPDIFERIESRQEWQKV